MRGLILCVVMLALAGCAVQAPAPVADAKSPLVIESSRSGKSAERVHVVRKGDTLQGIALDSGVDYRDLAAWNNIENPNRIQVGQQLRLTAPAGGKAESKQVAPLEGTEVRPITQGGSVEARSLDGPQVSTLPAPAAAIKPAAATPADSVVPASTIEPDSGGVKRSPKGGKQPYSEQALARLKAQDATLAPSAATPSVPAAPSAPATPSVPVVTAAEKSAPATPAPVAASSEGDVIWAWPASGKLIGTYTDNAVGETNKGVDIAGKLGDPVLAAASGKVVYVGSGLRGYGNLVIVRHNTSFLTAYAHNSQILVKEGQAVTRVQKIAEMGSSAADQPKLHFEVRLQGKPVDPLKYLPAR